MKMNYHKDHIDIIDILDDSELEFKYKFATDISFKIVFNIGKNINHPIIENYDKTNLRLGLSLKDFILKNPIMIRIEKLTGYRLRHCEVISDPEFSTNSIQLTFFGW